MKLKQIIFLLILTSVTGSAQSIAVNKNDVSSGNRIILTRNHKGKEIAPDDSVAKNGLVFFSAGFQKNTVGTKQIKTYYIDLDIFHNNNKLGCIKQSENNVILVLDDGSEITCFQMSETDCSQDAFKAAFALNSKNQSFEENEKNFKKLQSVGISKIKVITSEGIQDYKITVKSKDHIKAHFLLIEKTLDPVVSK